MFRQDELPRVYKTGANQEQGEAGYCLQDMDLEIQRVARELYKAFNGLNEGFKEVQVNSRYQTTYHHDFRQRTRSSLMSSALTQTKPVRS